MHSWNDLQNWINEEKNSLKWHVDRERTVFQAGRRQNGEPSNGKLVTETQKTTTAARIVDHKANFSKKSQVFTSFSESTSMRHSETRVAFVWRRHFRCWGGPWVTEFHWVGSASKRGLWVGTCIFGFSWVGTPVFSHFECRQARPEGFFERPVGRRRTEYRTLILVY